MSHRIAIIHPSPEVQEQLSQSLQGFETCCFDTLERATPKLKGCSAALCDIWLRAPLDQPLGDFLRARLSSGGSAIGLVAEATEACVVRTSGEKLDDFAMIEDSATVLGARIQATLLSRELYKSLDRRRCDAEMFLELSQTLASSLDVSTILHEASRLAASALGTDRCAIVLLDAEAGQGVMVAASEDKEIRDLQLDITSYPEMQSLLATSAPVIIRDASSSQVVAGVCHLLAEKNIGSELLFPILSEEQVIGTLFLRSASTIEQVDERQTHLGMTLASVLAVSIRNARLFDSFKEQTKRVNSMRLQAELRMRTLEQYEHFFEHAADGMVVLDAAGRILYLNREGNRILGRDLSVIKERLFVELLTDDSRLGLHHMLQAIKEGQHCRNIDLFLLRPTGEERSLSVSASPLHDGQDLAVLSFRDLTELREMQTELKTTKDFLENLIDSSVDGIVAADLRGNVLLFNKGAERIYGFRANEVIGQIQVWKLYPRGIAQAIMSELRSDSHGGAGRMVQKRTDIIGRDKAKIPVSITASIIYEEGSEVATVGIFSDLRERLQIERDLDDAQTRLIETEKQAAIAEIAGAAAHELNQPLTSVVGYSEMLRRKIKEENPLRRPVDIIYREAERMADIVRKIGRVTRYKTKPYGKANIVDLERSSAPGGTQQRPQPVFVPAKRPESETPDDSDELKPGGRRP